MTAIEATNHAMIGIRLIDAEPVVPAAGAVQLDAHISFPVRDFGPALQL
jgi:hypothetical protein